MPNLEVRMNYILDFDGTSGGLPWLTTAPLVYANANLLRVLEYHVTGRKGALNKVTSNLSKKLSH
jgi:hypothetical protein